MAYQGGSSGWLTAGLSVTTAPATLTLTPDPVGVGLTPGTYTATVTIRSPAASQASTVSNRTG